jgi:hypothetical protein
MHPLAECADPVQRCAVSDGIPVRDEGREEGCRAADAGGERRRGAASQATKAAVRLFDAAEPVIVDTSGGGLELF